MSGDPKCDVCHGRGGNYHRGQWRKCICTRVTKQQIDAQRRINSIGVDPKELERRRKLLGGR